MAIIDNERRVIATNRAARLLLRTSRDELRGRRVDDFTPRGQVARLELLWSRLMADADLAGVYDLVSGDGSLLRASFYAVANVLPGEHLAVFAPAAWPADELGPIVEPRLARLENPLSQREREVLSLVAEGLSMADVGARLTISVNTVRTHVQNASLKLGAENRPHAIALAIRLGLLEPSPDE